MSSSCTRNCRQRTCPSSLLCVCSVASVESNSETLWAPLTTGFSRQGEWSGLPFPPPGDLPDPGNEPVVLRSLALAGGFFTTLPPGKLLKSVGEEKSS